MKPLNGIHHVTAITGNAQRNVDFYSGLLGLRLVKKTVNFDDPGSYHLYYGDRLGSPGTLVTFFVWPGGVPGSVGTGEPAALGFSIPAGSLPWWRDRVQTSGYRIEDSGERFGKAFAAISDPDGMRVELVEKDALRNSAFWPAAGVGEETAIEKIHSVTLRLAGSKKSIDLYTSGLTFRNLGEEDGRERLAVGEGYDASYVDVVETGNSVPGTMGAGTIHHVAYRVADDQSQREWLAHVTKLGLEATPIIDRNYFHSIYFREPGHVLFEIATDPPGMTVDEEEEHLGEALKLPKQYESSRAKIERSLPPVTPAHLSRI